MSRGAAGLFQLLFPNPQRSQTDEESEEKPVLDSAGRVLVGLAV